MTINILLIEDNELQQRTFNRIFDPLIENEGYNLSFAKNFDEATSFLGKDFFDICLIDLLLEDEEILDLSDNSAATFAGYSIFDWIVDNEVATRPVIYTAHSSQDNLLRATKYGNLLYGFIPKSAHYTQVRKMVLEIVQKPLPFPKKYKSRNKQLNIKQCTVAAQQLSPDRRTKLAKILAKNLPLKQLELLRSYINELYVIAKRANKHPTKDPLSFDLKRFTSDDIKIIIERYGNGSVEPHYSTKGGKKYIDKYFFKWIDEVGDRHRHTFPPDHPYLLEWLKSRKND